MTKKLGPKSRMTLYPEASFKKNLHKQAVDRGLTLSGFCLRLLGKGYRDHMDNKFPSNKSRRLQNLAKKKERRRQGVREKYCKEDLPSTHLYEPQVKNAEFTAIERARIREIQIQCRNQVEHVERKALARLNGSPFTENHASYSHIVVRNLNP